MAGTNAEINTQELIHFWKIQHDDVGALFSHSNRAIVERTILALEKLERLEKKG